MVKDVNLIVEVAHVTEIYGPVQALEDYLKKNSKVFVMISHPLPCSSLSYSICKIRVNGRLYRIIRYRIPKSPEIISYIYNFFLTFYILLKIKRRIDIYIGVDNVNAFVGILFKILGFVNKVIFYVIDYTPVRFNNVFLNMLYHSLNIICVRNADYVWSVSRRIANIWRTIGIEDRKNIIVPIGVDIDKFESTSSVKVRKNVLVYAGHLTKSKGVQLVIEAMEELIKIIPDIKLEIIGTGPFEEELKKMVEGKKLEKYVIFLGRMDHDKLMKHLPTCGIALATYEPEKHSITYYADPTKPKEYLACGLPVIITRVPWIAKEIEKAPMGIVINYDKRELIEAIIKLLSDDDFYEKCKRNAIKFGQKFNRDKIFEKAFTKIQSKI
jgi:glycosyltransferase involved in cell wall biosynthesis